jgi:hypothetical protein
MSFIKELNEIPSSKKDLRKFGWTMGIVFGLLAGWFFYRGRPAWPYFAGAAAFFIFFGTLLPVALKPIQKVWMGLALVMGAVMSRVILGVLFIIVIVPIGVITRLAGIDFMGMRRKAGGDSYWTVRSAEGRDDMSRYERQA